MKLTYFDIHKTSHLIEEFYHITYSEELLDSTIMPMGLSGLVYVSSEGLKISTENSNLALRGLFLNGQFNKSYKFNSAKNSFTCGLSFKPTTFYKLTNYDLSKASNKYLSLDKINLELSTKLETVFSNHKNDFGNLFNNIENLLLQLPLIENKNTREIDNIVKLIHLKEGMISVNEILEKIPFGQKTLETQFKKMIGLTPSKYIRIYRFNKLMKKYESNKLDLKDLIYMYDYYDESHFAKDFKSFTSNSFKDYFKKEFTIIKEVLKK